MPPDAASTIAEQVAAFLASAEARKEHLDALLRWLTYAPGLIVGFVVYAQAQHNAFAVAALLGLGAGLAGNLIGRLFSSVALRRMAREFLAVFPPDRPEHRRAMLVLSEGCGTSAAAAVLRLLPEGRVLWRQVRSRNKRATSAAAVGLPPAPAPQEIEETRAVLAAAGVQLDDTRDRP
jgi:hypothetical protein